jgi:hypothetical protein
MYHTETRLDTLPPFALPVIGVLGFLLAVLAAGAADPPRDEVSAQRGPALNEAEQAFSDLLAGAILTGRFTVDGDASAPKEERYEIVAATKAGEHDWVIVARIKYGPNDVRVPVPVKVHWAGDTPVLSLTDLAIPGLGTFTSRVMFYGDRYAGTWQHGDKGGHLFGKVSKGEAGDEKPKDEAPK